MSGAGAGGEEAALFGLAPVAPDATLAYGPHPDQVIDLYGPAADGPVVLLLHGGFGARRTTVRTCRRSRPSWRGTGCRSPSPSTGGRGRAGAGRVRTRT